MPSMQFPILQFSYTDATGTNHPAAAAFLASISQDAIDLEAGLTFYVYHSADQLTADLQAAMTHQGHTYSPVAQHQYPLTMPQFGQFAAAPGAAGATLLGSEFADAVGLALSVQDTPVLDAQGNPTNNPEGTPAMQSFFTGATQTTVTVTAGS